MKIQKKLGALWCLCLVSCQISGCWERDLKFQIRYDQVEGLQTGDPVLFDDHTAGEVLGVTRSQEGASWLVAVAIAPTYKQAATHTARFLVVDHPDQPNRRAVEMLSPGKGGAPIASGEIVAGASAVSGFLARFQSMLTELEKAGAAASETIDRELVPMIGQELEKLKGRIHAMTEKKSELEGDIKQGLEKKFQGYKDRFDRWAEELRNLPDSAAMKHLETVISGLVDELAVSSEAIQRRIREEVLPAIERELLELKKKLEETHREDELAPIQTQLQRIRKV